jgi:hypothetical protein
MKCRWSNSMNFIQKSKNCHLIYFKGSDTRRSISCFYLRIRKCQIKNKTKSKRYSADNKFHNDYFLCSLLLLPFSTSVSGCHIISVVRSCTGQNVMKVISGWKFYQSSYETPNLLVAAPSALNVFDDVTAIGMSFIWRNQRHILY